MLFSNALRRWERAKQADWLTQVIWQERHALRDVLLAGLFVQLLALAMPLGSQAIFDKSLGHGSLNTLHVIAIGVAVVTIADLGLSWLQAKLIGLTSHKLDQALGQRGFTHVLALPLGYLESRPAGFTVSVLRDIEAVKQFFASATLFAVLDTVFVLLFFGVLAAYSVVLALVVFAGVTICVAATFLCKSLVQKRMQARVDTERGFESLLAEGQNGFATIKALGIEGRFGQAVQDIQALRLHAAQTANDTGGALNQFNQGMVKLLGLVVLWVGAWMVLHQKLTMGQLIAVQMISSRVMMPAMRLSSLGQQYAQMQLARARLNELFALPQEIAAGRTYLPLKSGALVMQEVSFRYGGKSAAIHGLSFTIPQGAFVAIVGASGSGKSTVGKLLQGLYVPHAGRITLNECDLQQLDPRVVRSKIGHVLQEPAFFTSTIAENLRVQQPKAPVEAIVEAAQLAGAHDFVINLPQGYDTPIGSDGVRLSGGQLQRLALARAVLANPDILILDEPTSALDLESERAIQKGIAQLRKERTLIIISHRPSLVREADQIFVLDSGRLVEKGTHQELVKKKGRYCKLFESDAVIPATTGPAASRIALPPNIGVVPKRAPHG